MLICNNFKISNPARWWLHDSRRGQADDGGRELVAKKSAVGKAALGSEYHGGTLTFARGASTSSSSHSAFG